MGVEYGLRFSGAGAKNLTSALWSVASSQEKTKGKTRLASLLKSGKELKVFNVTERELSTFAKEAKRYGVLYAIIKGVGDNPDKKVDVMVKAEDAAKINRIVERLEYGTFDETDVVVESERELQTKAGKPQADKGATQNDAGVLLGELLGEQAPVEGAPRKNPTRAQTESPRQSAPTSKKDGRPRGKAGAEEGAPARHSTRDGSGFEDERDRPSVKEQIDEKKAERAQESKDPAQTPKNRQTRHKAPAQSRRKSPKTPKEKGR